MRTALKYLNEGVYKPPLEKYLSKTRNFNYRGIRLIIPVQVLHPGFFFSTKLLLRFIGKYNVAQKLFLELGARSGLISIFAAQNGALVTATDIDPVVIEYLQKNSRHNNVQLSISHSDLFKNIPPQPFDFIVINPPYYKKHLVCDADNARYCRMHEEYFEKLFDGLGDYTHPGSIILICLYDGCDLDMITNFASKNNFYLNCLCTKQNLFEKNYIFKIESL